MKPCPYCGAEHPENVTKCPVSQNPADGDHTVIFSKKATRQGRYDIPPLPVEKRKADWVTILVPNDVAETNKVLGRLKDSGIEARLDLSQIGGGAGAHCMKCIQVRPKDYDVAKEVLNAN